MKTTIPALFALFAASSGLAAGCPEAETLLATAAGARGMSYFRYFDDPILEKGPKTRYGTEFRKFLDAHARFEEDETTIEVDGRTVARFDRYASVEILDGSRRNFVGGEWFAIFTVRAFEADVPERYRAGLVDELCERTASPEETELLRAFNVYYRDVVARYADARRKMKELENEHRAERARAAESGRGGAPASSPNDGPKKN